MTEAITKVFYLCGICRSEHALISHAEDCEKRGVKPYEFAKYEVVTFTDGSVPKRRLVVDSPWGEVEKINPHGDVQQYSVEWYIGPEPGQFPSSCKINTDVHASWLRKTKYSKKCCPLCSSKDVMTVVKEQYFHEPSHAQIVTLRNVAVKKCQNCGVKYFTEHQRLVMLSMYKESKREATLRAK